MKKRLEAELISIAHRILKLKNKSELLQLHKETQILYETLSVLKFVEENINIIQPKIDVEDVELKLSSSFDNKISEIDAIDNQEISNLTEAETATEAIEEPTISSEATISASENFEIKTTTVTEEIKIDFEPLFTISEDENVEKADKKAPKQLFEDLLNHDYNNLTFEKVTVTKTETVALAPAEALSELISIVDNIPDSNENKPSDIPIAETINEDLSTNDKATFENASKIITFGLNDRIGFEKQLFGGSGEDMNRVISQLSTYDTFEEAEDFIINMVKPDYNDWIGKEDYETRFMDVVAKKFN